MLRFKQQNRRDHVVSLLPPITVIKNKEPSLRERIYSDSPPPMTYTGSFPAKVLRHLDKSTFYSTPTKGETLLAKKTMHDEEQKTVERNEVIKTICSKDKDNLADHSRKNKTTKSKVKKKRTERKVDGMKQEERRCFSAPGFRNDEQEELLMTGNLTAPVTPQFNAPSSETSKCAGKTSRVSTAARSSTPRGFVFPDLEQHTDIVLELRGDRIGTTNPSKNSRISTPCMFDRQAGEIPEQGTSACPTRPKIRSAIREAPCTQKTTENIPPKFEIRAVGFSLPFHDKSESSAMTKVKKNQLLKDSNLIMKHKTIKIPSHETEDPAPLSLPTVTEAEGGEDENKESICDCDAKVDKNTLQNLPNENTTNEPCEKTEKVVKYSETLESSLLGDSQIEKRDSETRKENEHGNELNKPKTKNENDLTKEEKKKKSKLDKKGGHRNSKTKGRGKK